MIILKLDIELRIYSYDTFEYFSTMPEKRKSKEVAEVVPEPKLAELMPRGLETLGVVELVVELLEVAVPEELVSGGPHGFGSGSLFSVLEG